MSKLIIFGDSFAYPPIEWNKAPFTDDNIYWVDQVAKKLQVSEFVNFSEYGCSNDFIFHNLFSWVKSIIEAKQEDLSNFFAIVITTEKNRRWLFKEHPNYSNLTNIVTGRAEFLNKQQTNAVKNYLKYLDNELSSEAIDNMFSYSLLFFKNIFPNFLIIPGFNNSPAADCSSCLSRVSYAEFISSEAVDLHYVTFPIDPRLNHLSPVNHIILADKIIKYFNDKELIDFDKGFIQNIYT